MQTGNNPQRNRLIALIFASVLLLLIYGPLAPWFVAADRVVFMDDGQVVEVAPLVRGGRPLPVRHLRCRAA